jgi:hypothetical protein
MLPPMKLNRNSLKDLAGWVRRKSHVFVGWIGRRPPRVWATIYIFMIPFAGLIFCLLPGESFYDSNLMREAGFKHDLATVANLITPAIQRQEYGEYTGAQLPEPTWSAGNTQYSMDRNSITVQPESVNVDSLGNITFTISNFATAYEKPSTRGVSFVSETVTMSGSSLEKIFSPTRVLLLVVLC